MKIELTTLVITLASAFASIDRKALSHDFVGEYHTKAFDKLIEKYGSGKPSDHYEVMDDMLEAFEALCEEGTCANYETQSLKDEFIATTKFGHREVNPPENFHPKLSDSIKTVEGAITRLHEHNLEEVISDLTHVKEDIEDSNDIDENQKVSTLAGISVAIESTKLWHNAHYDEDHPLHFGVRETRGNRRLQEDGEFFPSPTCDQSADSALASLVCADIRAAWNFTIGVVKENINYLGLLPSLTTWAPPISAAASAAQFAIASGLVTPTTNVPLISQVANLLFDWNGLTFGLLTDASIWFKCPNQNRNEE